MVIGRPVSRENKPSTGDGGPVEQNKGLFPSGVKVPEEDISSPWLV